ncbi:MAG: hypothetical protein DFNUSKGM_001333 [Candidatus Fervidibacter sacchari]|jgi:hypothetical protein
MRKSIALMNDVVIAVSERGKHLLPLVLIAAGSIWLSALAFQWTISLGVVWVLGDDYDFGKVPQGKVIEHRVWLFNPHTYPIHLQFETGCGCTVIAKDGADLLGLRLEPFGWHTISIKIETAGLEPKQHLQVVWIKVRESDKIRESDKVYLQPIWLRFSLYSSGR